MRIGVCGVRGLGRDFLRLFGLHPDVEAVYCADLTEEARSSAAAEVDVAGAFEAFDELLTADVDCVAIFTPPWCHADMAVRSLEAGKHVMSACPAGLTLEELRRIVDAVERSGRIYMTAETSYYYLAAMHARVMWAEGRFGEFVYGEGEYYYRPHHYDFWMRDDYGAMPPMLYPTHSTGLVVSVTGERFTDVTCVGRAGLHEDVAGLRRRPEWRDNDVSNMTMLGRMSGGGSCRINEMRNVGCKGEMGSIIGTLGSLRAHSGGVVWTDGHDEDVDLSAEWRDPARHPQTELASKLPASYEGHGMGHEGSHRFLADEFVRAVRDDRRPHNHVWAAVEYCAPGIVAWESLKAGGAWMTVPDFGEPSDGREELDY